MSTLSTHILDTSLGTPAAGVRVMLERVEGRRALAERITDVDGRVRDVAGAELAAGTYCLRFDVAAYFARTHRETFYPEISVTFVVRDRQHYHVPLLVSPFGYSTYRGS
jgi:5-hydroxyisourate hydrolase